VSRIGVGVVVVEVVEAAGGGATVEDVGPGGGQLVGAGRGVPGQGFSCPTTVVTLRGEVRRFPGINGPPPFARNGMVSKELMSGGLPKLICSGKIKSNMG